MSNEHEVRALSAAQSLAEKIVDIMPEKPRSARIAQEIFAALQDEHAEISRRLIELLKEHKGPPEIHLRRQLKALADDLVNL